MSISQQAAAVALNAGSSQEPSVAGAARGKYQSKTRKRYRPLPLAMDYPPGLGPKPTKTHAFDDLAEIAAEMGYSPAQAKKILYAAAGDRKMTQRAPHHQRDPIASLLEAHAAEHPVSKGVLFCARAALEHAAYRSREYGADVSTPAYSLIGAQAAKMAKREKLFSNETVRRALI